MKKWEMRYKLLGLILLGWALMIPIWIVMLLKPYPAVIATGFLAVFTVAAAVGLHMWRITRPVGTPLPRNLLKHYEETVNAMMELEDRFSWLSLQRDEDEHALASVMRKLEQGESGRACRYDLEGTCYVHFVRSTDGTERWAVSAEGDVAYIRDVSEPLARAVRARELGFRVI